MEHPDSRLFFTQRNSSLSQGQIHLVLGRNQVRRAAEKVYAPPPRSLTIVPFSVEPPQDNFALQYRNRAKASFSAYLLVKNLLETEEKVHFSTKKSTTNFGLLAPPPPPLANDSPLFFCRAPPRQLGWTFRIFFIFFLLRGGKGGVRGDREGGGGRFFIENPRRGGSPTRGVGGGREDVCREFGELGGGGLNIFFRGRNARQDNFTLQYRNRHPPKRDWRPLNR